MSNIFLSILAQITSLIVCRFFFSSLNFHDYNNALKKHEGDIPYSGGISIFIVVLCFQFFINISYPLFILSISSSLLSIIFFFDDFLGLSPKFRLFIQVAFSFIFIFSMLDHFSFCSLSTYKSFSIFLSACVFFCFYQSCVMNSINLIDGVDGLASGCVLISLITLLLVESSNFDDSQFILYL